MQEYSGALDILSPSSLPSKHRPSLHLATEAVKRCSTNRKCMKLVIIISLPLPKVFNAILLGVWCVWPAASAFFIIVIYAPVTLGSIISLLCAVAVHNSCWDLGRDTSSTVQTRDTMPCFNSNYSPSCVHYSRGTLNGILWGYLSLKFPLISRFQSCMFYPQANSFFLGCFGYLFN